MAHDNLRRQARMVDRGKDLMAFENQVQAGLNVLTGVKNNLAALRAAIEADNGTPNDLAEIDEILADCRTTIQNYAASF